MSNTCHDMNTLMKDFFDGRLRRRAQSRLFSHLKMCTTCRDAFEKEKEIIRQIRVLPVSQCPDFVIKSIEASTILKEKFRRRKEKEYVQWSFVWKPVTAGVFVIGLILLFTIKPSTPIQDTIPKTYTQEEIEKAREQAKYSLALVANTLKEEQEHVIKDVVFKNVSQTIRKSVGIVIPILGGDEK